MKINQRVIELYQTNQRFDLFILEADNFALEKYSSVSKCFNHGSIWEQYIDQCRRKRSIFPQVAGCYHVCYHLISFYAFATNLSVFFARS